MKPNIGLLDRYVRLASGLIVYGAGAQMRRGSSFAKGAMMTIGAMKIAEGITGWCPVMYACGVKTTGDANQSQQNQSQQQNQNSHGHQQQNAEHDSHSARHDQSGQHQKSQQERDPEGRQRTHSQSQGSNQNSGSSLNMSTDRKQNAPRENEMEAVMESAINEAFSTDVDYHAQMS